MKSASIEGGLKCRACNGRPEEKFKVGLQITRGKYRKASDAIRDYGTIHSLLGKRKFCTTGAFILRASRTWRITLINSIRIDAREYFKEWQLFVGGSHSCLRGNNWGGGEETISYGDRGDEG